MAERTEKDILDKIETHTYLYRRDIETIKRYVAAAFWITVVSAVVIAISLYA